MVNWNNETTVSTPAGNLVKLLVLEARYNTMLALEFYNEKVCNGIAQQQSNIKARLGTWYLEHQPYLERSVKDSEKLIIRKIEEDLFFSTKRLANARILEIIKYLNEVIDRLKITKLDNKQQYNSADVEADNAANEYF